MNPFEINISWSRNSGQEFKSDVFSRDHKIIFSGAQALLNSSAPEYFGNEAASNPEALLAAALASCHMLTFLVIASKSGFVVESYDTKAEAILSKNESGKMSVTEINLYPKIIFSGSKLPDEVQLKSMHDKSHHNCFIAQSIKSKVNIF